MLIHNELFNILINDTCYMFELFQESVGIESEDLLCAHHFGINHEKLYAAIFSHVQHSYLTLNGLLFSGRCCSNKAFNKRL